jgi:hypothetical protein
LQKLCKVQKQRAADAIAFQAALDEKQAMLDYALSFQACYKEAFGKLPGLKE